MHIYMATVLALFWLALMATHPLLGFLVVSGQSKPVRDAHLKNSHFEGRIALGAEDAALIAGWRFCGVALSAQARGELDLESKR